MSQKKFQAFAPSRMGDATCQFVDAGLLFYFWKNSEMGVSVKDQIIEVLGCFAANGGKCNFTSKIMPRKLIWVIR